MAKLSKLMASGPIALSVEGVYIRNMSAKAVDAAFGNLAARMKDDHETVIEELFNNLVCDEDGNSFDDVATFDDITGALSLTAIQRIVNAIPEALSPTAANAGK